VTAADPSANFHLSPTLQISSQSTALIWIDIASVLPAGTVASQVVIANLQLWTNKSSTNPAGQLTVIPAAKAFTGAVTYNTRPPYLQSPKTTVTLSGGVNQYVIFDVTEFVRLWLTSPATNNGFAVGAPQNTATNVLVDSRENTETGHPPMLDITLGSGKSFAVCLNADNRVCTCSGKLMNRVQGGSCSATSETGPCSAVAAGMTNNNPIASCCVCLP
jgi:hypothetical protein